MFKLTQSNQEFGGDVAKQESVEFQFIPLGTAIEAVVMRLSSELPRIKVRSVLNEGGISEDGSQ